MHAWLWDDRREPDTKLILHSHPLAVRIRQLQAASATRGNKPCLRSSSKVAGKRKADDPNTDSSSRQSTESDVITTSLAPGSNAHEVHWIVLSSTSEYFKRRVTTSVGPEASNASISPFKYVFSEQLEWGQLEAAASVLQTMYTQELAAWGGSGEDRVTHLLLMLQVWLLRNTSANILPQRPIMNSGNRTLLRATATGDSLNLLWVYEPKWVQLQYMLNNMDNPSCVSDPVELLLFGRLCVLTSTCACNTRVNHTMQVQPTCHDPAHVL